MRLRCWKMFAACALLGVLVAPANAQKLGQAFATFTIGGVGNRGENIQNGTGLVSDVLFGIHVGKTNATGSRPPLTIGLTAGQTLGYASADACVVQIGSGSNECLGFDMPNYHYLGALAGTERRGSGGLIGLLAGPVAMFAQAPPSAPTRSHSAFAFATRFDAFANLPTGHLALGISAKDLYAPNFRGLMLNSISVSIGLRVQ